MTTLVFIDNDVISKLASCDLLDDAITVLGLQKADVRILGTFKHRFGITNEKRRAKVEQQVGVAAYQRLIDFQGSVGEVEVNHGDLLTAFEDLAAIDAGEAQLYAEASEIADSFIVTGDKRSIRSLASAAACREICQNLSGRVICFEQLIKDILSRREFHQVKGKIVPAVDCDSVLRCAFGSGLDAEEAQVHRVLDANIAELREATGNLLRS